MNIEIPVIITSPINANRIIIYIFNIEKIKV